MDHGDLPDQLVAGCVAAGVVDDLELIEIQVQQGILGAVLGPEIDRPLQSLLELAPVGEPRQGIVRRLVVQLRGDGAFLRDVAHYQHHAGHRSRTSRIGATRS